ncbi:hypothetical protein [Angustibacter aerolatus]
MTRVARAVRPVALAALAAAALGGCSTQSLLGLEQNTAVLSNRAVLQPQQAVEIAGRALAQAERADAVQTTAAARTAYTGLALDVAGPTYTVAQVLDPEKDRSGGALEQYAPPSRVVVTAGRDFPRTLLAVGTPEGGPTAQLSVLSTPDVRTPYRVAARADLLPGAELPATAPNERGAATLAPDVEGLVATPERALRDYAKLLQTGTSGGTDFADDVVVDQVRGESAKQRKGVEKVARYRQTHAASDDDLEVVRTADGGALLVGVIERHDVFTVRKGAGTIKPPAAYAALADGKLQQIRKKADVTTVQMVAMVLPPKGAGDARVVGFSELPTKVTAS